MTTNQVQNPDGSYTAYATDMYTPQAGALPVSGSPATTNIASGGSYVPPTTINSTVLSSTPSINFTTPTPTPLYPVSTLDSTPPATLTAPEQKAQTLSDQIQSLYSQDTGQSEYRTQQETAQGVPELQKTQNDLAAKLKSLQNEAQAIPLQLQQESTGRGITAGGLQPIQTAALRNNAIQALSTSSLLEASRGNLTTALNLVDRAVKAKFDPIEEKIKAATANLQLIVNSPEYSLADKNRAQQQLEVQNKKVQALEVQKQNAKDSQTAIVNIITANPNMNSAVMEQLRQQTNPIDVARIAAQNGLAVDPSKLPSSAQEYLFAVQRGYKGTYSQYQNEDANRKVRIASASVVTPGAPTSYKEWELAGKPGTYAQYLQSSNIKAPTAAQQTVSTYAARIEQANPTIDNLTSYVSSLSPLSFEAQSRLPSYLQSAEFQQYDQAARNFINATLRRESGAVISPSEFDNAYKQYLPRAGDTQETLDQKKQNRDIVFASLRNAAGNAYQSVDELLGKGGKQTSTPQPLLSPAQIPAGYYQASDGLLYKK